MANITIIHGGYWTRFLLWICCASVVSHSHFMLSHLVPITVLRHVVVSYFLFPLPLFSLLTKPNSLTYADLQHPSLDCSPYMRCQLCIQLLSILAT
ncbi:hypothetical protein BDR03DRAFT_952918 [Suillus americanus]|nr:hypothetical protein BDR03DRAFT_952918 [Suillus americanus]